MKIYSATVINKGAAVNTIVVAETEKAITDHYDGNCTDVTEVSRKKLEAALLENKPVVDLSPERKDKETTALSNIILKIEEIVNEAKRMKNAFFFESPGSAGARRSYEDYHSHDTVTWCEGGNEYSARFRVRCSCRYVYANGIYTKNGEDTNLKAIRYSLARLKANLLLGEY